MNLEPIPDRRAILAGALLPLLAGFPAVASSLPGSDPVAPERSLVRLAQALAELGLETGDPLILASALRSLAWAANKRPSLLTLFGSERFQATQQVALDNLPYADETGLRSVIAGFPGLTRGNGPGAPNGTIHLEPGNRPFIAEFSFDDDADATLSVSASSYEPRIVRNRSSNSNLVKVDIYQVGETTAKSVNVKTFGVWDSREISLPRIRKNGKYLLKATNLTDLVIEFYYETWQ